MFFEYSEDRVSDLLCKGLIVPVEVVVLKNDSDSTTALSTLYRSCDIPLLCCIEDHFSSGKHGRHLVHTDLPLHDSSMGEPLESDIRNFADLPEWVDLI